MPSVDTPLPLVSIGMPIYNRLDGLKSTLGNLQRQSYGNIEIIVSDNCSPNPAIQEFMVDAARQDPRIRYVRQPVNIGRLPNFHYVLAASSADYFMWAADDDLHAPKFVEACMAAHLENPRLGLSFARFERVDARGRKDREVVDTTAYNGRPGWPLLRRLIAEPEFEGRANLFYGVWKRSLAVELMGLPFPWHRYIGADDTIVVGALLRAEYHADRRILFRKVYDDPHCGDEVRFQHFDFARPEPWYFARFHRNPEALYCFILVLRGTRFLAIGCLLLGFRFAWEAFRELRALGRKVAGRLRAA